MICYKDQNFCRSDCENQECFRYLDAGIEKDAEDFGLPISSSDYSKSCPYYLPPKRKNNGL
jgi:hypothetical protein